ncbi:GGDEF domain-containing protein [Vibrio sp. Isolate33]|uniref:GGDEF domain-containing protein n=1 Tax=Vibrio sp. Isolate33 TaxID=2908539 RepID=UPI001EFD2BF0|nr:GGDEF domain-containing protein [Vibrio sp. Isolate33]MCG9542209.1 GGDEF domain-containing protein [Vibrio sp. Isolate33]
MPYINFIYIPISIFCAFIVTDYIHFGTECLGPIISRFILFILMMAVASYCIKNKPNVLELVESIFLVISSLFLIYVGRLAVELNNFDYQGGIILVMIYIGTFSRLSAKYSITTLSFIFSSYLIGLAPLLYDAEPKHEIETISVYLSAYILISAACIRRDLEVHKRFAQSEQLRKQAIQLRKQSNMFEALSYQDALTGCYNRLYLHQVIEPSINRQLSITSIMIDIDHFKSINDTYGHQMGDMVIKELAAEIQKRLPSSSNCFRYGGEEFLVMVQGETETSIKSLVDSLLDSPSRLRLEVTISIGVKHAPLAIGSVEQLIDDADQALYISKKNGRNQVTWCD